MTRNRRLAAVISRRRRSDVARRNYALWSEAFDNAVWVNTGTNTVTADAATAPDGTTTADAVVFQDTGFFRVQQCSVTGDSANRTWTYSVWLKAPIAGNAVLRISHPGAADYTTTVAVTTSWQRFSFTQAFGAGIGLARVDVGVQGAAGPGFTYHVWGHQLEEAGALGPYTKTTTTPAP